MAVFGLWKLGRRKGKEAFGEARNFVGGLISQVSQM